jgi:hypothetical protein
MNTETEYETTPCTPIIGDIENDIPGDNEWPTGGISDRIIDDMDAQLEDECLDSIWAV